MTFSPTKHILIQARSNQPLFEQLTIPGLDLPELSHSSQSGDRGEVPYQDQNLENLNTPSTPSQYFVQLSLFPEDYEI
jgi:hypothetical protein